MRNGTNSELPAASFSEPHAAGAEPSAHPGSGFADWTNCGPNSPLWILGLVLAFGFLACCLLRTINLPWVEEDNWYGAFYSQAAHNNLRAGILASGGVPASLYFGPLPIPKDAFYVHHPTLLPLLVTGAFATLGEAEWVARLVPITASLVSVLLIWTLMRSLLGRRAAALSAAFFVTLPMELHYGDMVDFEPCLLMWMLAALVCLRRWDLSRNWKWAVAAVLSCQMALWMDWPGYLFVLSVAAGFLIGWLIETARFPAADLAPIPSMGDAFARAHRPFGSALSSSNSSCECRSVGGLVECAEDAPWQSSRHKLHRPSA